MTTDQELRSRIMRRVYALYFFRQVSKPSVRLGAFITSIITSLGSVSVPSVLANLLSVSGLSGLFRFIVSAIVETELLVQLMVPIALAVAVWFVVDLFRKTGRQAATAA